MNFFLCLILFFFLLPPLLSYTLYCYEVSNSTGKSLFSLLPRVFLGIMTSLVSSLLMVVLFPLSLRRNLWRNPSHHKGNRKALVILVHGLFHNPTAWIIYRHLFHKRGYTTACFSYSSWRTRPEELAERLVGYISEQGGRFPEKDIFVVGHSLGGMLLRMAAPNLPEQVKAIVTLGAPFGGSKMAPFALHSIGRFLRYDSETIRMISTMPFPPRIRGLALWSPCDSMVLPGESLHRIPAGWQEEKTPSVSHVSMLHSPRVFRRILRWLESVE